MVISLLTISSYSQEAIFEGQDGVFLTPMVKSQIKWFLLGTLVFLISSAFDYNKLREWTWFFFGFCILSLLGLFFAPAIAGVHRWYKIPFVNFSFQPSELAKLIVVMALSWYLERNRGKGHLWSVVFGAFLIVFVPFILILKEPDLGSALVLFPVSLVMFYFGGLHPWVVKTMTFFGAMILFVVALLFLEIVDHEALRPYATKVLKEYQFDRLDPKTPHQLAAATAIAIGGITGMGWHKSEYGAMGWLPAAYTDSVFPAFGEEFGFLGLLILIVLLYTLIYLSFQVAAVAKDPFGRLLAAGVAVYLAMHILMNIGMMCGFLPITGVPLVLVTYGGSQTLVTMAALGLLQSVYSRRFMF
jgi:rod shape determining protein RodA